MTTLFPRYSWSGFSARPAWETDMLLIAYLFRRKHPELYLFYSFGGGRWRQRKHQRLTWHPTSTDCARATLGRPNVLPLPFDDHLCAYAHRPRGSSKAKGGMLPAKTDFQRALAAMQTWGSSPACVPNNACLFCVALHVIFACRIHSMCIVVAYSSRCPLRGL